MYNSLKMLCAALSLTACVSITDQNVNSVAPTATVPALAAPSSAMPKGALVPAPRQFMEFCAKSPEECVVPHTPDTVAAIAINAQKTHQMVNPTEEEGDTWQALSEPGQGDCEDYALTLRSILRQQFPEYSAAFLVATAYTETNEYHAVLTIETDRGTLVCDIRFDTCAPWENFPYAWRLREIAGSDNWQELGPYQPAPIKKTAAVATGSEPSHSGA